MGQSEFPKYEMIINGRSEFMRRNEAVRAYDCGFVKVEFGSLVLNEDFTTRPMTEEEKRLISDAAEEYSGSK